MEPGRDLMEVIPAPVLVACVEEDDVYCIPLRAKRMEDLFWAFALEEYINLAHSIYGLFECSFWAKSGFGLVSVQTEGQRVGVISQYDGIQNRLSAVGLGHFFGGALDMMTMARKIQGAHMASILEQIEEIYGGDSQEGAHADG
jgi:hypothetical protein